MRIKIKKNPTKGVWYSDKAGENFEVTADGIYYTLVENDFYKLHKRDCRQNNIVTAGGSLEIPKPFIAELPVEEFAEEIPIGEPEYVSQKVIDKLKKLSTIENRDFDELIDGGFIETKEFEEEL